MKLFLAILFFTVTSAWVVRAEIPAGWSTNYDATMSASESSHQPVLVYFTASWCEPCRLMSRITLTDPDVKQAISDIERVAVDIDEHPDIASNYNITAVPTFVMLSTAQNEAGRITSDQTTDDLLQWLTNSISGAKADAIQRALSKENLGDVDQLLASKKTNSIHEAAVKLFDLCDERDAAVVQAAADRLKTIANRDPSALLVGLDDPRLATRIQVANVLHYKFGDLFDVDPWSDTVTREKKILAWSEQLAKMPGYKASN